MNAVIVCGGVRAHFDFTTLSDAFMEIQKKIERTTEALKSMFEEFVESIKELESSKKIPIFDRRNIEVAIIKHQVLGSRKMRVCIRNTC